MDDKKNKDIIDNDNKNIDETGNNNLSDNKVSTDIEPKTIGNNVDVSLCSCTFIVSCNIS